jgi:hypothetical protein
MSRFSIAGIQMHITMHNNISEMRKRMEILFHLYPWVQMVVFSELAPHGPALSAAQEIDGRSGASFRLLAGPRQLFRKGRRQDL